MGIVVFACHFPKRCKIGRGPKIAPFWEMGCPSENLPQAGFVGAAGPHAFAAEVARGVLKELVAVGGWVCFLVVPS